MSCTLMLTLKNFGAKGPIHYLHRDDGFMRVSILMSTLVKLYSSGMCSRSVIRQ